MILLFRGFRPGNACMAVHYAWHFVPDHKNFRRKMSGCEQIWVVPRRERKTAQVHEVSQKPCVQGETERVHRWPNVNRPVVPRPMRIPNPGARPAEGQHGNSPKNSRP